MSGRIEHRGKVVSINGSFVDVAVEAQEACSSCRAKNVCMTGGGREKLISAYTPVPQAFKAGEEVEVSMEQTMGMKAVTVAYIIPFFIVLAQLLIMLQFGLGELAAGSTALAVLALYYIGVYIFRDRIEKEIVFKIDKVYE